MDWKFHNPTKIVCGPGTLSQVRKLIAQEAFPLPLLVITTKGSLNRPAFQILKDQLNGIPHSIFAETESNPSLTETAAQANTFKQGNFASLLAFGGGSAIDTAKIFSACLSAPANWTLRGHLVEGTPLHANPQLPILAIPSTAGTGAEVTPFATVWHKEKRKKLSLAAPSLFPRLALVDSDLLLNSPKDILVSCGLDALSQALESIWNRNATPASLALAQTAVQLAFQALPALAKAPANSSAASAMAEASLLAGICISQTRTALAHAISYPLTAHFDVPHGLACGITLPAILRFNATEDVAGNLTKTARNLGFDDIDGFATALTGLLVETGAKQQFSNLVNSHAQLAPFIPEMLHVGRSDNNLRTATLEDISKILEATLSTEQ